MYLGPFLENDWLVAARQRGNEVHMDHDVPGGMWYELDNRFEGQRHQARRLVEAVHRRADRAQELPPRPIDPHNQFDNMAEMNRWAQRNVEPGPLGGHAPDFVIRDEFNILDEDDLA